MEIRKRFVFIMMVIVALFCCKKDKALDSGNLWAWGAGGQGQLGLGTKGDKNKPIRIQSGIIWKQVSVGENHTLAIKNDNTLWACGDDSNGQLGTNATGDDQSVFTQVGQDSDWKEITAGANFSLAIKNDGTLWAWGDNSNHQLGLGEVLDQDIPIQVGTHWKQISAGEDHVLAIKDDNTLWGWGSGRKLSLDGSDKSKPTQIDNERWKQISAGKDISLAIHEDGSLFQLGAGNPLFQIGIDKDWVQVSAGRYGSPLFAINQDGILWGWGGGHNMKLVSAPIGEQKWIGVTAGNDMMLGIQDDGTLWACGLDRCGQLGTGDKIVTDESIVISELRQVGSDTDWKQVLAGGAHVMALK